MDLAGWAGLGNASTVIAIVLIAPVALTVLWFLWVILSELVPPLVGAIVHARFWREPTSLLPLVNLVVLVAAYALYAGQQTRSFDAALGSAVSAELARVLPEAVATEVLTICLLWLVLGGLLGLPLRLLVTPLEAVLALAVTMAMAVGFTALWMGMAGAVGAADPGAAVLHAAGLLGLGGAWAAVAVLDDVNPYSVNWAGNTVLARPDAAEARSLRYWRRRTVEITSTASFLAGVPTALVAFGVMDPPGFAAVLGVELVVFAVMLVCWYLNVRRVSYTLPGVPGALAGLVNLGLAGAAAGIAAAGSVGAGVTLGPLPPLLVAVLPGLLVALVVLVVEVLPHRPATTRGFWACVAAAPAVGALAVLVKPVVEVLFDAL